MMNLGMMIRENVLVFNMWKSYMQKNKTFVSIVLFFVIFGWIQWVRPAFLFTRKGAIREFGVGTKNKTILPIGLLAIVLGILSYVGVFFLAEVM